MDTPPLKKHKKAFFDEAKDGFVYDDNTPFDTGETSEDGIPFV